MRLSSEPAWAGYINSGVVALPGGERRITRQVKLDKLVEKKKGAIK